MADEKTKGAFKTIAQRKTAEDLSNLLTQLKQRRSRTEIDWRLNLAYYRGNQYTYWNPGSKRVESVPVEDGQKPRYRVRIVSNQVVTGCQSLLSKVVKTKPRFSASPSEPGDKAIKAAEFAETLIDSWWRDFNLGGKYEEAVLWSFFAGRGYWKVSWDAFANKAMTFLLDPNGQPITDQAVEEEFRALLEQNQIPPDEQTAYLGDLKVEVMNPMHVWGDPAVKNSLDWKWVICQHNLDPDDVYARFGKRIAPDAVSSEPDQTMPLGGDENQGEHNVVRLFCLYHLPSPAMPKGRYIVWTESGGKQILHDQDWPWPKLLMLPIVEFTGIKVPGSAEGDAIVTHARPLQKQLNRMLSQITEYFNLTIRPQWLAPTNSLKTQMTNEPGKVITYNPVPSGGGSALRPEPLEMPMLPAYVFEFLREIGGRLREVFGLTEVTEGTLPPNLEAADAIDLLQEMATDRFAPAIEANERALARAGQIMLELAQEYYEEPRMLTLQGFGGAGAVKAFTRADISGGIMVRVEAGSSMPRSRAARRRQVAEWIEMGVVRPEKAYRHYDIADVKDIAAEFALDEDHALREHEKIIKGVPLNMEMYQQAMTAVQQGMNPQTGQPLQSPEEAQQIVTQAALSPGMVDNAPIHAEKHAKYIKSREFESHSPEIQQRFMTHYELTQQQLASQKPMPEAQAPRVSMQIKGAVGPTAMSKIMETTGVQIDPQTLATEPPMETMVIDSVDKPDADAGGAGMEANDLSQAAQTMMMADLANAKAQMDNANAQDKHEQSAAHADELHSHAARKAKADADLAEKRAKESSFKPKPKSKE